jgi:hypothetical protein
MLTIANPILIHASEYLNILSQDRDRQDLGEERRKEAPKAMERMKNLKYLASS